MVVVDSGQVPYPKSVFFIITNEFCERFSYYGMKAVLALYLVNILNYSEDQATVIYHVFSMLCYFTPIFGAMIADSFLGKFKTILYLSIVYAIGNMVLSAAATTPLQIPTKPFSIIGLLLIAIGTGGIKPCVSAFGGDQFVLPQQATQLASFFSIFYFAINAGSLLSTYVTPIFRKDIRCFGGDSCYPLAFGVPAVLMVTSLIVFVIGYRWYTIRKPTGNITAEVCKCVSHAVQEKNRSREKRDHWLDFASPRYDYELISSVKQLLKVLLLYIPLPVFWALFDQQGSRWTFQATRMKGDFFGTIIKPDQMQVLNPVLILAFIPIFDQGIYPALSKIGLLKKPLQRLTVGGILAGLAFVITGFVELKLEPTYAVKLGVNESHLNFVNDLNCPIQLNIDNQNHDINATGQYIIQHIDATKPYDVQFTPQGDCKNYGALNYKLNLTAHKKEAKTFFITGANNQLAVQESENPDLLEKDGDGAPLLKFIFVGFNDADKGMVKLFHSEGKPIDMFKVIQEEDKRKATSVDGVPVTGFDSIVYKTDPAEQKMVLITPSDETKNTKGKTEIIQTTTPKQGGNYLYVLKKGGDGTNATNPYTLQEYVITKPNSIHILWLIPQYVVITIGEVMFSVTGLQFAYSQAPESMKSVVQAAWLLTVAFGNVIVVFLAEFKIFEEQWKEFFMYAGLMFVDMVLFAILAKFYVPIEQSDKKDEDASPNTVEMKENMQKDDYYNP